MFCLSFATHTLNPEDCRHYLTCYIYGYYARRVMFDTPHIVALCVILFDHLIRMPAWKNINSVLSRLIQPSCLERCWLLLRPQRCLVQSAPHCSTSQAKISVLITSEGQAGRGHTGIQAGSDADTLVGGGKINTVAGYRTVVRGRQAGWQMSPLIFCDHERKARTRFTLIVEAFIKLNGYCFVYMSVFYHFDCCVDCVVVMCMLGVQKTCIFLID